MKKQIRKSGIDRPSARKWLFRDKQGEKRQSLRLEILKILHQHGGLRDTCERVVSLIKEYLDCDAVALRLKEGEDYPYFVNDGFPGDFIESENYLCQHDEQGNCLVDASGRPVLACMCGIVINAEYNQNQPFFTEEGSFWTNSTTDLLASTKSEDRGTITRNVCNQYGYESVALTPVKSGGGNVGLIQINSKRRDFFTAEDIAFLEEIGHIVGAAVAHMQVEEALRISEQKFKDLAETTTDWVWEVDEDGVYTYVSPKVKELLGYEVDEVMGKVPFDFMPRGEAEKIHAFFREKVRKKQPFYGLENVNRHKDGHLVTLETNGIPIFDEKGRLRGYRGIDRDITGRKQAEEILKRNKKSVERLVDERTQALLRAQAELVKAKRLSDIGTLAATVAHELRNPLGVIRIAAYNIRRKSKNPSLENHLANIEKKIIESDQIINNLLFYSRIRAPRYESTGICKILDECIATARKRRPKYKVRIERECNFVGNDCIVEVDSLQLGELFDNILSNAFDAFSAKKGKITIKAGQDEDKNLRIVIRDNGTGINKADLKMLFEPFFTRKSKGTGLGLTVCHQIVTLHGGTIDVKSRKGKGTTVVVTLPSTALPKSRASGNFVDDKGAI